MPKSNLVSTSKLATHTKIKTMNQKRISMSDIILGRPLPWDVFDANGRLLLRKGVTVQRAEQVEKLVQLGLFVEAGAIADRQPNLRPIANKSEIFLVLRMINLVYKSLYRLLLNPTTEPDFQAKFLDVSKDLIVASTTNPDLALASILLNQVNTKYSVRHCIDTAIVSVLVARSFEIKPEELLILASAALSMNISMIRQQEMMQGQSITDEDRDVIRNHPQASVNLLQQAGITNQDWLSYVLAHHENEDGSGYPHAKKSHDIPQNAKIIAVADRYCARISSRTYRKSLLPNAALRDILMSEKKHIDPALISCFIKELGIYPTGTYVRLENGEIGVVTGKGSSTTTPIVHALVAPRGAPLAFPIKRDSSISLYAIRDVLHEEQAGIRVSMHQLWGEQASL